MRILTIEQKGDSIFSNLICIDENAIYHKQLERKNGCYFFRAKKRVFRQEERI